MILFQCSTCQKNLRALEQDAGKIASCPCGAKVWVPGESQGFWVSLLDRFRDTRNWDCPQCRQKVPVDAEKCPHCNAELPTAAKFS
jgi:DNA-directed RNA polymerase subunit RPC12/RpoP